MGSTQDLGAGLHVMRKEARFVYDPRSRLWLCRTKIPELSDLGQTQGPSGVFGKLRGRRRKGKESDSAMLGKLRRDLLGTLADNDGRVVVWCRVSSGDGRRLYELVVELEDSEDDGPQLVNGSIRDISHQEVDALTGLYRTPDLVEDVQAWMRRVPYSKVFRLYFADLDGLHHLNETYGYTEGGDLILHATGEILDGYTDRETRVIRVYGDEFAILAVRDSLEESRELGERLKESLHFSILIKGVRVQISFTVGDVIPEPGESARTLVKRAAEHMRNAKPLDARR